MLRVLAAINVALLSSCAQADEPLAGGGEEDPVFDVEPICGTQGDPIAFPSFKMVAPHSQLFAASRAVIAETAGGDAPGLENFGAMICGRVVEDGTATIFNILTDDKNVTSFTYNISPATHGQTAQA